MGKSECVLYIHDEVLQMRSQQTTTIPGIGCGIARSSIGYCRSGENKSAFDSALRLPQFLPILIPWIRDDVCYALPSKRAVDFRQEYWGIFCHKLRCTILDAKLRNEQENTARGKRLRRATEVIVKFRRHQVLLTVSVILSSRIFRRKPKAGGERCSADGVW